MKLKEPDLLEDRPDMLRKHDEQIAKVYNDVSSVKSNVLAIYTGKHNSWISSEVKRFKRDTISTF